MKKLYSLFLDIPWFVFLIPFIFILNELRFVFFEYSTTTTYDKIVFAVIILLSDLIIFALCWLLTKNKIKAGILSLLPLLCFNYYFDIYNELIKLNIVAEIFISIQTKIHWIILLIIAFLEAAIYLLLRKAKMTFRYFNFYLNIIFIIFFSIEVYKYFVIQKHHVVLVNTDISAEKTELKKLAKGFPNIYFIIFDSYTNNQSLKKYWNYDNSSLKRYFTDKGFWFSEKSHSAYTATEYSVSSTLNSSYLNIKNHDEADHSKKYDLINFIRNSEILNILKKYNYHFIEYSIFKHKSIPGLQNFVFENLFFRSFVYLMQEKLFGVVNPDYWKTNDDIKNSIEQVHKEKGPFLLYAHFSMPHAPYIYDSTGNKITDIKISYDCMNKYYYLSQLKYTNKFVMEVAGRILEHDKNSIIIIQGDHGFRFLTDEKPSDSNDEAFSILNTIYIPNSNYAGFPDTMNAVNTFRYVFNNYFKTNFRILENKRTNVLDPVETINK